MGRVLTVTGRLAETPYRIRKIERNVYSHLHRHDRKPACVRSVIQICCRVISAGIVRKV